MKSKILNMLTATFIEETGIKKEFTWKGDVIPPSLHALRITLEKLQYKHRVKKVIKEVVQ